MINVTTHCSATANPPGRLRFEQPSDGLWVATLDGGASYRIEMRPGKLGSNYDLTFIERRPSVWARCEIPRYESVSAHRSLGQAIERANRHRRDLRAARAVKLHHPQKGTTP